MWRLATLISLFAALALAVVPDREARAETDEQSDDTSITVVDDAHDGQDFAFSTAGEGLSAFVLDDDSDPTLASSATFTDLDEGTYTITEDPVVGWRVADIVCSTPQIIDLATRTVTITLAEGDHVTCTFTNATDRPLVGAIRWDAWNDGPAGQAVEYTLGPPEWHHRLPWFAEITGPDTVEIRADNQEVADAEILRAAELNLDYFAFVWYDPHDVEGSENETMSRGLRYYRSSPNHDLVKYTVVISPQDVADPVERVVLLEYLHDPNWVKVDGRPLIFVGMRDSVSREVVDAFRADSVAQGTGDPYIAYMPPGHDHDAAMRAVDRHGYDAVSTYSFGGGSTQGDPYSLLVERTRASWDYVAGSGYEMLPSMMAGWDPRPRLDRPPYWGDSGVRWYAAAGPGELEAHLQDGIEWARDHGSKAAVIYAWNEYDEGGWIAPNLVEDEARQGAVRGALSYRPEPTLAIADATAPEGDSGSALLRFGVTLSSPASETVTVEYETVDGDALAPDDYAATSGTLTFLPGETTQSIEVEVHGDTEPEPDEPFTVVLRDPQHAALDRAEGVGTIEDDDGHEVDEPTDVFLSDLTPTSVSNWRGPVERDMSNGGAAAGDGGPIRLNGVVYGKGLGVHATSTVTYTLDGTAEELRAEVGVDDECGPSGSVVFQVYVDGEREFGSAKMTGTSETRSVSVDLEGANKLTLKVTNAGDGYSCDHADWADARLKMSDPSTTTTTTTTTPTTTTTTTTEPPSPPTTTTTEPPPTTTTTTTEPPPTTTTTTTTEPPPTTTTTTEPPPPTTTTTAPPPEPTEEPGVTYLSDLTPTSESNWFGPVERDTSNGGRAEGDGRPIRLNGVTYEKGLGVHATSTVTYRLDGSTAQLLADVGVDDECGPAGSVVFEVYVDGERAFDSGKMTGTSETRSVSLDLEGALTLTLRVTNAGDGYACDHADWADARLESPDASRTTTTTTEPPPTTTEPPPTTTTTTTEPPPTTTTTTTEPPPTTTTTTTEPPPTTTTTTVPPSTTTSTTTTEPPPTTTSTTTTTTAPPTVETDDFVPAEADVVYLSDLTPTSVSNRVGPMEPDTSNGGRAEGDGSPIRLNGVTYEKGLGVHATSIVTYSLDGATELLLADIGVDDECGSAGSVVFQVFLDGELEYESERMTGTSETTSVAVDLDGATTLTLRVTNAGDGYACDHADWADARVA